MAALAPGVRLILLPAQCEAGSLAAGSAEIGVQRGQPAEGQRREHAYDEGVLGLPGGFSHPPDRCPDRETSVLEPRHRNRINALALGARLPTMHGSPGQMATGGLLYYGPDYLDLFRRTAEYVDKILRGAKPVELPVEQPTKLALAINLKTAKALGLTIPPSLRGRADEVIE